jgi:hypothetical protein
MTKGDHSDGRIMNVNRLSRWCESHSSEVDDAWKKGESLDYQARRKLFTSDNSS